MVPHQLHDYPFPVAYPARLFEVARDPADRIEKALNFVELSFATLGVLGLAWCRAHGRTPGGTRQWEAKLDKGGITLNIWNGAIRAASKEMTGSSGDPVARAIRLASEATIKGLEDFMHIRNTYAHGGKPRLRPDQDGAVGDLADGVSALLDHMAPLANLRLGLVRAGGQSHSTDMDVMSGYAEPFGSRHLRSTIRHDEGTILAYHSNSLEHAFKLSPYAAWGACPTCGREELFYLHHRKRQRSYYFSFSTGHELAVDGDVVEQVTRPAVALAFEPLGTRTKASSGWRANWADLASPAPRIAARVIDLVAAYAIAIAGWIVGVLLGLPPAPATIAAIALLCLYEPVAALRGGTPGKRLLGIEPISVWDGRALNRADTTVRAALATLQAFPPVAAYNLAWLLADPARQCLHDRRVGTIVVSGRTRPGQKL